MVNTSEVGILIKAEDKASRELAKVEGSLGKLESAIGQAGKILAGFTVAAGAAAGAFAVASIKQYSEVGDAVEKMSIRTGLGAKAVSALRVAAEGSGTAIDTVESAVKKMQIGIDGFADKGSAMATVLHNIGVPLNKIKTMKPEEQFVLIGNAIADIKDPALRTQAAVEAFGKSGTDLLPLFAGGTASLSAWNDQAVALGVSFDDLSAKKAAELNDAIGKMKTAFNGLMLKVGGELAPVITSLINDHILPLLSTVLGALPTLDQLKQSFESIRIAFETAMTKFEEKTGLISQVKEAFASIWTVITTELMPSLSALWEAMQPLMPVFSAIAEVVGVVIILALKTFIEFIKESIIQTANILTGLANVTAFFYKEFEPAFRFAGGIIDALADKIQLLIKGFNQIRDAATNAFDKAKSVVSYNPFINPPPGRAVGGPVTAGMPYIVGERGPELFMPGSSGSIIPRLPGSGGGSSYGGITINIGSFFGGNPEVAAREIGNLIIKRLQLNSRV